MAAALQYQKMRDFAPRLVAKGNHHQAEKIVEIAASHQIPVVVNKELIEILMQLDVNMEIPEIVFQTVAEIYTFIRYLEKQQS